MYRNAQRYDKADHPTKYLSVRLSSSALAHSTASTSSKCFTNTLTHHHCRSIGNWSSPYDLQPSTRSWRSLIHVFISGSFVGYLIWTTPLLIIQRFFWRLEETFPAEIAQSLLLGDFETLGRATSPEIFAQKFCWIHPYIYTRVEHRRVFLTLMRYTDILVWISFPI